MTADTPDRNLARAAAAASLLVLVALFWPTALRRVFVYGDLSAFFLPMRIFLAEQLARGRAPIWMPDLFCGFYAHGEGQIGIFHPLRWLLYRFLPVPEAFNLECLLPYPLALIGVALFVRRLALPASAAIFGGATFAFSAYLTLRLTHVNALAVIAHLGWLLYAIDVALREPGRRRYRAWLAIALVTGSQLLVGYPVAIAYCWLIAAPYAVWTARSRGELAPLAAVASAIATGVLLGAIQLLPTYDYLMTSERADPSYEYLTEMSLHPLHLLSAVAPWLFRNHLFMEGRHEPLERAFYFGPVVPIAALWIALRWRALGEWRALVAGLAALSAVALILALGGHTFFYRPFLALPLVGWLRVPARYTVVLYFSGAVFTAIAFADLLRAGSSPEVRQRSRWLWIVPAASWLVAGVGLAVYQPIPEQARVVSHLLPPAKQLNDPPWILLGPIVFTLAAALFSAAARGRRAALFALIPLVLADQAAYAAAQWWVDPPCTIAEWRDRVLPRPVDPPLRVTTPKSYYVFLAPDNLRWWSATTPIVSGTQMVRGYVGLTPSARLDYAGRAAQRVAGAGADLDRRFFTRMPGLWLRAGGDELFHALSGALPRARLVANAVRSAQPAADLESIDVETTALVEEPVELERGPAGSARIQQDWPGAIRIAIDAPTRQLLVLAESFHAGWRAEVDGAAARVLRVNGDFIGVVVAPGAHELSLSFAPRSFELGCWTSLVGIAIVLTVALAGCRAR